MEALLELARGPLFRFTFVILLLGLGRNVLLAVLTLAKAYADAGDKKVPYGAVLRRTLDWFLPYRRVFRVRPLFSLVSVLFHLGLILVPIFLYAHVSLWRSGIGIGWPALSKTVADLLTIGTIVAALLLLAFRLTDATARALSRASDYLWPILLAVPFVSGFLCVHSPLNPLSYNAMLLIHILSAELIFVLIPFTKIAHCVMVPFSQLISEMGWRFPAGSGEKVEATLGKKGVPI